MYKLKKGKESFTIVDGEDEGKTFEKDVEYANAPAGYESRFEKVKLGLAKPGAATKRSK